MTNRTHKNDFPEVVLEFEHDDGSTLAAHEGSELASLLRSDPEWELVASAAASGSDTDQAVADLSKLKRAELNTLAADHGIENPQGLANAGAVIAAIEKARAGAEYAAELAKLGRPELESLAIDLGLEDPTEIEDDDDLVAAIVEARGATD